MFTKQAPDRQATSLAKPSSVPGLDGGSGATRPRTANPLRSLMTGGEGIDRTALIARSSLPEPATGDVVDWGQIGTPNLNITTPQSFISTGGTTGTVNLNGTGFLVQQCCIGITGTFDGDFAPGDTVLVTSPGSPLRINFNKPVQAIGSQIQDNLIGDHFTAEIDAFHGSKLLGSFTENGFSGDAADNSNVFLGVQDKHPDITSVVFLTSDTRPSIQSTAINFMTIAPGFGRSVSPN
jgi:hypothetical protein